ncbi:hypothetical protein [uncultured Thomasclavelia sp.]|uniref:hypothetical protein n=1 Tax=uncultured Thomasclavelia sp. TaxID=3025759 RepID=UPI0025F355A0|nr:hypothetical protein [uncultured Thomasclavelia sp.]
MKQYVYLAFGFIGIGITHLCYALSGMFYSNYLDYVFNSSMLIFYLISCIFFIKAIIPGIISFCKSTHIFYKNKD